MSWSYLFDYVLLALFFSFFFFNDAATTEIYTLSLHDALPIFFPRARSRTCRGPLSNLPASHVLPDRKSTRLNSSHTVISYAVFCLKKKKNRTIAKPCTVKIIAVNGSPT